MKKKKNYKSSLKWKSRRAYSSMMGDDDEICILAVAVDGHSLFARLVFGRRAPVVDDLYKIAQ